MVIESKWLLTLLCLDCLAINPFTSFATLVQSNRATDSRWERRITRPLAAANNRYAYTRVLIEFTSVSTTRASDACSNSTRAESLMSLRNKAPSLVLGMTKTSEKLVFSDASDNTLNYFVDTKVTVTLGESEGSRDGYSPCFNSPSHITS